MDSEAPIDFFSTFPAGFDRVIARIIEEDHDGSKIDSLYDNAVIYRTSQGNATLTQSRCFSSTYQIIDRIGKTQTPSLLTSIRCFGRRIDRYGLRMLMQPYRSFRLVVSEESRLASIDRETRQWFEALIGHESRKPIDNKAPAAEVWVASRREGSVFLLLKPAGRRRFESAVPKGSLQPEVAALLCRLADPSDDDVFLDPFCGHGGIFFERLRSKYRMAFALDSSEECVRDLKARLDDRSGNWRTRTYVKTGDGSRLDGFEDGFITSIVTDPPWGEYDRSIRDVYTFYKITIGSLLRVLREAGMLVILSGRSIDVPEICGSLRDSVSIIESHDVLISGRKASVYKMKKHAHMPVARDVDGA